MALILERMLRLHAQITSNEEAAVANFMRQPLDDYDAIMTDHEIKDDINMIVKAERELAILYADENKALREELEQLRSPQTQIDFIDKIIEQIPQSVTAPADIPSENVLTSDHGDMTDADDDVEDVDPFTHLFIDEEAFGSRLALSTFHKRAINLYAYRQEQDRNIEQHDNNNDNNSIRHRHHQPSMDYITYLQNFVQFNQISINKKLSELYSQSYYEYLNDLLNYFIDFF